MVPSCSNCLRKLSSSLFLDEATFRFDFPFSWGGGFWCLEDFLFCEDCFRLIFSSSSCKVTNPFFFRLLMIPYVQLGAEWQPTNYIAMDAKRKGSLDTKTWKIGSKWKWSAEGKTEQYHFPTVPIRLRMSVGPSELLYDGFPTIPSQRYCQYDRYVWTPRSSKGSRCIVSSNIKSPFVLRCSTSRARSRQGTGTCVPSR